MASGKTVAGRLVWRVPWTLVTMRFVCGPGFLIGAVMNGPAALLVSLLSIAFVSDIFDGIIARRLGVATAGLRRADTITDILFYVCAIVGLLVRSPEVLRANVPGIAAIIALELIRFVVERVKFGRLAAYHLWSAKLWGIALFVGFTEAIVTGAPGPLFCLAIVMGVISDLEGLAVSVVFSQWHHDVPTIVHALAIERRAKA
ncbi:MAG: CDP-alcohol phosphatidyltransferase family protein [Phycisphaeraceae bacterium]|nr:CDP-alcohol phosphatidyltransferase family protein [Phycisphaeraceae bacterium]